MCLFVLVSYMRLCRYAGVFTYVCMEFVCACACVYVCVWMCVFVCMPVMRGHAQRCPTPGMAAKSILCVAFVHVSPNADHHESG